MEYQINTSDGVSFEIIITKVSLKDKLRIESFLFNTTKVCVGSTIGAPERLPLPGE